MRSIPTGRPQRGPGMILIATPGSPCRHGEEEGLSIVIHYQRIFWGCLMAFLILYSTGGAVAQAISGSVVGTIRDSSGAVAPKASVTATNDESGISQSTITGAEGEYTVPNLPPGNYKIRVQLRGFTTAVASGIAVRVEKT